MNLQTLLFPKIGICTENRLYFRLNELESKKTEISSYNFQNGYLKFNKADIISFDTYFNSFSIEKWKKYTKLKNVSLRLKMKGKFIVNLIRKDKINEVISKQVLLQQLFSIEEIENINLNFESLDENGIYYFEIKALDENVCLYGGEYYTEIDENEIAQVNIGIGICTFKREAFIYRNIQILKDFILNNHNVELKNHLDVYIADNGQTLEKDKINHSRIHLMKNKNTGGAGGFTRTIIEMNKDSKAKNITHVLLMDDDIIIEPLSIIKTFNFLRIIKEEFKDSFVGGAMLRLDNQFIQTESGATWNAGELRPLKHNLDLREVFFVLENEEEEYVEYNAWWYCCFPLEIATLDNLPLPIFIRGDDLEYGLRNMKNLILLNGICVWHEPFENKYSSFLEYYITRNLFIDNSIHFSTKDKYGFKKNFGKKDCLKYIYRRIARQLVYYRYKNVDLIFKAVDDFLKGMDFWKEKQDGEVFHKSIMEMGYKAELLSNINVPFNSDLYKKSFDKNENKIKKIIRILTFNGMILPVNKRYNVVSMAQCMPKNFYRVKEVLNYDVTTKKGFITKKNNFKNIQVMLKLISITLKVLFKYNLAKQSYKMRFKEIANIEFWRKYLELKDI